MGSGHFSYPTYSPSPTDQAGGGLATATAPAGATGAPIGTTVSYPPAYPTAIKPGSPTFMPVQPGPVYTPLNTGYADGATPIGDPYAPGSFTPQALPGPLPSGALPYLGTTQQQATGITTIDTAALSPTSGYDTLRLGNAGYGNSAYSLQAAYAQIGIGQAPPTLGNHSSTGGYGQGSRFVRAGPVAPQPIGAPLGLQGLQIA